MNSDAPPRHSRPILVLANGHLNGRVPRLVADALHSTKTHPVRVITTSRLNQLHRWPEERQQPHIVPPEMVDWTGAERAVTEAGVFVLPPTWEPAVRDLIGIARRAGTPVVYVVADMGYGARKLEAADASQLPNEICVADPITRGLLIKNGIAASIIRNTGSPFFDSVLAYPPPPPPAGSALRVGLLASPNGARERVSNRAAMSPDGVLPAVDRALQAFPGSRLTIRLHPRQDPSRIHDVFKLPESASFDPFPARSTFAEFVADHHVIVSSHSMGLLAARLLGRPAVSFQPPIQDDGLRREIFAAWDVPVATDENALAAIMRERLRCAGEPLALDTILYRPRRSLEAITRVVLDALSTEARPTRRARPSRAASGSSAWPQAL